MHTLTARNVNEAFMVVMNTWFTTPHMLRDIAPRGRRTLELKELAAVTYLQPRERVLFCPTRNANPVLHLMDALWMLAGRDDVAFMAGVQPRFAEYSDNGATFHGAYGLRLQAHDQMALALEELERDPQSRRAVLALWQPAEDAGYTGRDMPCNCTITLKLRENHLHMTVFNRSNDAIWGAYGANVVQFSMLLEYLAIRLGVGVGTYTQISDSLHIYPDNAPAPALLERGASPAEPYSDGAVRPLALLQPDETFEMWEHDLKEFFATNGDTVRFKTLWWRGVVMPMWAAHRAHRVHDDPEMAAAHASSIVAADWRFATTAFYSRIAHARRAKTAGGAA